jgi:hypothetical protein
MTTRIKIFDYLEDVDGFLVTDEYHMLADELGLTEWHPVVWIGRLFLMDNDFGEHWFDNWDIREQKRDMLTHRGLEVDSMLFLDPQRFQDGKDGPCHSATFRKHFWTNVLQSLELDLDLILDKAKDKQKALRQLMEEIPDDSGYAEEVIPNIEQRIAAIMARYASHSSYPEATA